MRMIPCEKCNGSGVIISALDKGSVIDCPACNGYGQIQDSHREADWLEEEYEQEEN